MLSLRTPRYICQSGILRQVKSIRVFKSVQATSMFDKMAAAKKPKKNDAMDVPDLDDVLAAAENKQGGSKSNKNNRLSVERIYQKKTQLEHILLRPDTYIGSVEKLTQNMWVWNETDSCMEQREITYVPGLYKIFDEILVNASDNKQRDPKGMNCIKIDIDPENNMIKIWNNGKGIPVVEHKVEKVFVPTLIFGTLLTSSNYDDSERKVTGGRNGYGAKLCNIFSTKFVVETSAKEYRKSFRQSWTNNMSKPSEVKIGSHREDDYTAVTFYPDLKKFKMDSMDRDIVDLFTRRAYDIAASSKGVKVILNGKRVPVKNFKEYCELYTKDRNDEQGNPLKLVYESVNDRWEVAVTLSEKGFQQMSFVNSIATTKGGRHTDHVADQVVSKLIEVVKKKNKKDAITIKPFQVKNHLWVFVNCLIENPTFDSQTKENMTLQLKSFGSKAALTEKFIGQVNKCGIIEAIMSWMKFKAQEKMNQKCGSKKHNKLKGIPKLDDANNAGTKNSLDCTLILTEGDSAKTLAVAGLGVVGRDRFGVFPLRGKLLNVREATGKQIMENPEINNIIKIMGLRYKEKYDSHDSLKTLRYGKIMIMTDQDQDGSHIKGLLINFIHHNWPGLLKQEFLEEFITPIVKVRKKGQEKSFYSLPEFEEWKKDTEHWHTWEPKYYKGLGTSTSKEAKEYFSDMDRHRIAFKYAGNEDDQSILLAFSKKMIEQRKEWLTNWMEERKRRAQLDLPEIYLYGKQTKNISYNEFVNRELILFSNMDNERSIPSLCDGLKPGQRKVLFTFFKRNLVKSIKVAQVAGSVSEMSAYHHGEQSLMMTIIGLAQNFVGSNNVNVLEPIGQFGTRLQGGKDAASPRYIFTKLSPLARILFNAKDDPLFKFNFDDNRRIEPEWYLPIIPMVLVNGADGIGTGWSTKIPNYDVREIVRNIRKMINGQEPIDMMPSYKNFRGTIENLEDQRFAISGEIALLDDSTVEISELPVKCWTQTYKEQVLEPMLIGTDKVPATITDYKEYHTDTTVRFVVKMAPEKLDVAERQGLHKYFKLQSTIATSSMVLFDDKNVLRRYNSVMQILREFYEVRMDTYRRRKDYLEGMLAAESLQLDNKARFILEKIKGEIVIENKPKKELIQILIKRGYDSDPVKAWKDSQNKLEHLLEEDEEELESQTSSQAESGADFNYILGMPLWCLTQERKNAIIKERDEKSEELYLLRKKTPCDLWEADLDCFMKELEVIEKKEREDDEASLKVQSKSTKGRKTMKKLTHQDSKPSAYGRRVEPVIHEALKKTAAAAAKKRKAIEIKSETNGSINDDLMFDDDEDSKMGLGLTLAERIGGSPNAIKPEPQSAPMAKKPREKKVAGSPKAPKKPREKKTSVGSPTKKGGKRGKKRNPWSSEEEDEMSGMSDSDASIADIAPAKDRAPRRAAGAKAKYNFGDDSDDMDVVPGVAACATDDVIQNDDVSDDDDSGPPAAEDLSDGSDFDFAPVKTTTTKSRGNVFGSDSDLDTSSKSTSQSTNQSASQATSAFTMSSIVTVDDSDSDEPQLTVPPLKVSKIKAKKTLGPKTVKQLKEPKPKKPKATKRKKSSDVSDFSDDDDFSASKKTKKDSKKKARKFSDSEDDVSFGDDDIDDVKASAAGRTTGRARTTVQYDFGASDEDSD